MTPSNTSVTFATNEGVAAAASLAKILLEEAATERLFVFCGTDEGESSEALEALLLLKDRYLDRLSLGFVMNREGAKAELLAGRLDGAKVHAIANELFDPASVGAYYTYGSSALVEEVSTALKQLGVQPARIRTQAAVLPAARSPAQASSAQSFEETHVELVMDGRRRAFTMRTRSESILAAAARAGIDLPFSCKAGVCATCRTKLVRGRVELAQNYALEDWELQQGFILACQAHAQTPEIELTYDEK